MIKKACSVHSWRSSNLERVRRFEEGIRKSTGEISQRQHGRPRTNKSKDQNLMIAFAGAHSKEIDAEVQHGCKQIGWSMKDSENIENFKIYDLTSSKRLVRFRERKFEWTERQLMGDKYENLARWCVYEEILTTISFFGFPTLVHIFFCTRVPYVFTFPSLFSRCCALRSRYRQASAIEISITSDVAALG
jgi:hypothetical protein